MKIIRDIPDIYCDIIEDGLYKPNPDTLSVTDLINPPLIKHLKLEKWDELEQQASDFLWLILGSAAHQVFETSGILRKLRKLLEKEEKHKDNAYCPRVNWENEIKDMLISSSGEKPIEITIKNKKIRGRLDFRETGIIRDFKITSAWSFMFGVKQDWENQLNIYDFMCAKHGIPVDKIFIDAILRDWSKTQLYRNKDYPEKPFISMPVKKWDTKEQYDYILSRLSEYRSTPKECSEEEKWSKPTTYAVKKKGNKRAKRVLNSMEEAHEYIEKNKKKKEKLEIEVRKGEPTRCLHYCPVRSVCPYSPKNKE